nr:hypothetical protein [Tanacetum cinerariifolium]
MPLFSKTQNHDRKKSKTSETTSCLTHSGLNLNEEVDGSGEEVRQVRPIVRDRAKNKASSSSRLRSSSIVGGDLVDLLRWPPMVTLGRLLPHARGLGSKPRRGGFPSGAKKKWGLSPKAKVRVLHTAQLMSLNGGRRRDIDQVVSNDD